MDINQLPGRASPLAAGPLEIVATFLQVGIGFVAKRLRALAFDFGLGTVLAADGLLMPVAIRVLERNHPVVSGQALLLDAPKRREIAESVISGRKNPAPRWRASTTSAHRPFHASWRRIDYRSRNRKPIRKDPKEPPLPVSKKPRHKTATKVSSAFHSRKPGVAGQASDGGPSCCIRRWQPGRGDRAGTGRHVSGLGSIESPPTDGACA